MRTILADYSKRFLPDDVKLRARKTYLLVILKTSLTQAFLADGMISIYSISPSNWLKIACISALLAAVSGLVLSGYRVAITREFNPQSASLSKPISGSSADSMPATAANAKPELDSEHHEAHAAPLGILDSSAKFAAFEHFDDAHDPDLQTDANPLSAVAPLHILDPAWKGNTP